MIAQSTRYSAFVDVSCILRQIEQARGEKRAGLPLTFASSPFKALSGAACLFTARTVLSRIFAKDRTPVLEILRSFE
jgi:hypothetical protein